MKARREANGIIMKTITKPMRSETANMLAKPRYDIADALQNVAKQLQDRYRPLAEQLKNDGHHVELLNAFDDNYGKNESKESSGIFQVN